MTTPKGMFVPVVTPFKEDQSIDFESFEKVIDYVVSSGLDGILIAGSTGEYHTMTLEEQMQVIKKGCEFVAELEYFWANWVQDRDDIVFIACGSATRNPCAYRSISPSWTSGTMTSPSVN